MASHRRLTKSVLERGEALLDCMAVSSPGEEEHLSGATAPQHPWSHLCLGMGKLWAELAIQQLCGNEEGLRAALLAGDLEVRCLGGLKEFFLSACSCAVPCPLPHAMPTHGG